MTAVYLEAVELRNALSVFVDELVKAALEAGLRATPGGVISGMGFDYAAPYLIVQGLYARGMLHRRNGSFELMSTGKSFVKIVVEVSAMITKLSGFPEPDSGRLVGAVAYALYDWNNAYRTASGQLDYARKIQDELAALKKEPELFKLAAFLLPRMYYEGGYTPLKLIESVKTVFRTNRGKHEAPQLQ